MENYRNQKIIDKLKELFLELDDFDKEKFINEFIFTDSSVDMMSFLNNSLNRHNLPKYIDQKEIQKFLDTE